MTTKTKTREVHRLPPTVTDAQWRDAQDRHWHGTREEYAMWRAAKDESDSLVATSEETP